MSRDWGANGGTSRAPTKPPRNGILERMKKILLLLATLPLARAFAQTGASETIAYRTLLNEGGSLGIVKHFTPADYSGAYDASKPFPAYDGSSGEMYQVDVVDVVGADLRGYDLRDRYNDLIHSSFDTKTKWPDALPKGFDPQAIMETGKDPGLNVRELHRKGITGKNVGIAVLDSWLYPDHDEYRERLKGYEEIHAFEEPTPHGTAVASLAVGKTVGVAPGADLYYVAVTSGLFGKGTFEYDYAYLASAVDRIRAINKSLPASGKIRVLTITIRIKPERKNYDAVARAIRDAESEGIFVVYVGCRDYRGLYRDPSANPNDIDSYRPGLYWSAKFYADGQSTLGQGDNAQPPLLVPSDSRCAASPSGASEYAFDSEGGLSWAVPYLAGAYALACQACPGVTPEAFWKAALETGKTVTVTKDGKKYSLGKIIDPEGIIDALADKSCDNRNEGEPSWTN